MPQSQAAQKPSRVIVVDADASGLAVALVEGGRVVEALALPELARGAQVGAVYLGRVQQVLPGMGAAFIDIGLEKHAFLQLEAGKPAPRPGQDAVVQVVKIPGGEKGVRVTGAPELTDSLAVLSPGGAGVGVSTKIEDAQERARLKALGEAHCPPGCALVLRTAAAGREEKALAASCRALWAEWEALQKAARHARAPALLMGALHPAERCVLDLLGQGTARIVANGGWPERMEALVRQRDIQPLPQIELYGGETPLRALYSITTALEQARRRKVWLPGGGTLVFDVCEAMTVVDVNAGKQAAKKNPEETALAVNLEAMREIAAQLRLRDIGGIVVIDSIDLCLPANRQRMLDELAGALNADRGKPRVFGGVSELGLIQLTRKRLYAEPNRAGKAQRHHSDEKEPEPTESTFEGSGA